MKTLFFLAPFLLLAVSARAIGQEQMALPSTDLSGVPQQWQIYITWSVMIFAAVGKIYSSIVAGGGLKRIIMRVWFGEGIPKVIAQDYHEELNTSPKTP